jgi:hypothetical protein
MEQVGVLAHLQGRSWLRCRSSLLTSITIVINTSLETTRPTWRSVSFAHEPCITQADEGTDPQATHLK